MVQREIIILRNGVQITPRDKAAILTRREESVIAGLDIFQILQRAGGFWCLSAGGVGRFFDRNRIRSPRHHIVIRQQGSEAAFGGDDFADIADAFHRCVGTTPFRAAPQINFTVLQNGKRSPCGADAVRCQCLRCAAGATGGGYGQFAVRCAVFQRQIGTETLPGGIAPRDFRCFCAGAGADAGDQCLSACAENINADYRFRRCGIATHLGCK